METQADIESDLLGLEMVATWDRPRSTEQLLGFIARRETAIADIKENV